MGSVRIELDGDGIRALLGSDEVQAMLAEKAERIADAVRGSGVMVADGKETLPVEVVDAGTAQRARAIVAIDHPAALAVEAKHRVLGAALDAAR